MCEGMQPAVPGRERDPRLQSSSQAPLTPSAGLGGTHKPVASRTRSGCSGRRTVKADQDSILMRKVRKLAQANVRVIRER